MDEWKKKLDLLGIDNPGITCNLVIARRVRRMIFP
jgi:hypothetical protein